MGFQVKTRGAALSRCGTRPEKRTSEQPLGTSQPLLSPCPVPRTGSSPPPRNLALPFPSFCPAPKHPIISLVPSQNALPWRAVTSQQPLSLPGDPERGFRGAGSFSPSAGWVHRSPATALWGGNPTEVYSFLVSMATPVCLSAIKKMESIIENVRYVGRVHPNCVQ